VTNEPLHETNEAVDQGFFPNVQSVDFLHVRGGDNQIAHRDAAVFVPLTVEEFEAEGAEGILQAGIRCLCPLRPANRLEPTHHDRLTFRHASQDRRHLLLAANVFNRRWRVVLHASSLLELGSPSKHYSREPIIGSRNSAILPKVLIHAKKNHGRFPVGHDGGYQGEGQPEGLRSSAIALPVARRVVAKKKQIVHLR
jgi:hypothetical protein